MCTGQKDGGISHLMGSLNHLDLLREEHLELLNKYADLQQKYAALQSKVDPDQVADTSTLSGQLCATLKNLFENHAFSDLVIRVDGREFKCHKFLLVARSNHWNDLESTDSIEIPGDATACEFLASAGADLNFVQSKTLFTPLHYVAFSTLNQSSMAEWVSSRLKEMNINVADAEGRSALLLSIVVGNIALTKVLLKHGADVDSQGRTACHLAVQQRNAEALLELLKASDVDFLSVRDKMGQTPFSQALFSKEHALAAAIVKRLPHVALQTNGSGMHFDLSDIAALLYCL
ncbi:ankyrin repeat protein [Teladorsagia circumcincta]|uniref:Ankyrin repeat protein n=1 Tax=Teladorsagia circumcincta TaxID=45464 RepID=A0A2G9UEN1_TELCI|nr:ankyrin repeat protein [Teladorsagia circumcincta]